MEGNQRTLALVTVAVAVGFIFFAFTQLTSPGEGDGSAAEAPAVATEAAESETSDASAEERAPQVSPAQRMLARRTATITTEHFVATIDNLGGGVSRLLLTGDARFTDDDGEPIDVISTDTSTYPEYDAFRVDFARIGIPADAVWDIEQVSETAVRLRWEGNGLRVTRSLSAGAGPYQIWSTLRVQNTESYARGTRLEMSAWHYVTREDESGGIVASRSPFISSGACVFGEETERKDREKLVEEGVHGYGGGDVQIAAVENVYFVQAMATHEGPAARCSLQAEDRFAAGNDEADGTLFGARLAYPWVELAPGAEQQYRTLLYIGPKDPSALNTAGHALPAMVDLGFFSAIGEQLARLLSLLHQFVPNWGLAIILLTLMIRLVLFPLTNLSFKSMARMRQLKPEIDRINELYKDDPEKKGAAVMEIYRKNKINPLSGCLPSLAQLPVWWALYTSLSTNIELYHMPFALWWTDLSSPDPYYVLPIMLGGLMHLQQRLTPTTMDPAQAKMMMYFMPIMITVFMLFLPSGLCLYMLTNSALGIGQQKLNEYRLAQQAPAINTEGPVASSSDETAAGDDAADAADDKPQSRRPRRKRRVRRGRA